VESDLPSLRKTISPSPCPTPQISSQKTNYSSDPVSPESHGGRAGADQGQNARPRASPRVISQDPPSDTDCNHSGTRTNLENTLGSRNVPRRDVSNKGSGEFSVRKLVFPSLRSS